MVSSLQMLAHMHVWQKRLAMVFCLSALIAALHGDERAATLQHCGAVFGT
jgi:hypothetical protein